MVPSPPWLSATAANLRCTATECSARARTPRTSFRRPFCAPGANASSSKGDRRSGRGCMASQPTAVSTRSSAARAASSHLTSRRRQILWKTVFPRQIFRGSSPIRTALVALLGLGLALAVFKARRGGPSRVAERHVVATRRPSRPPPVRVTALLALLALGTVLTVFASAAWLLGLGVAALLLFVAVSFPLLASAMAGAEDSPNR
jgi:hypothetical protein